MTKENKTLAQERRNVLRKVAATGILGSSGIAHFTTLSAGSGQESTGSEGDETTVGPDMHLPGGGGTGASDNDYDAATAEANSRSDTAYDYTTLNEPDSNKTDLTVNDTVIGNEFTVDGSPAKITYKDCGGVSRQMVVSEVSITVEGSEGTVTYSQWAGVSKYGCIYIGDSNGCVRIQGTFSCDMKTLVEASQENMDAFFSIANSLYDRAKANNDEVANASEAVLWAIIAVVGFFLIALGNIFTGATS